MAFLIESSLKPALSTILPDPSQQKALRATREGLLL